MIFLKVENILDESNERRFQLTRTGVYPLAYLISEPEEKKLKWTDLKIGDVIRHKLSNLEYMIIGIDRQNTNTSKHIRYINTWLTDDELRKDWEKVEE